MHELSGPEDENVVSRISSAHPCNATSMGRESACVQKGQGASLLTHGGRDGSEDPRG